MTAYISIKNLSKSFNENDILTDVSFDMNQGTSMALVGPSAAGKTVLLKCMLGLHHADGGEIIIDGLNMHDANNADRDQLMRRIGVLFQQNALFDSQTIWENVSFRLMGDLKIPRAKARDRAIELLHQVGLGVDVATLYPADLSGGMQKRVGLARAIATEPDILILDDPTAGLDPILAHTIDSLIDRIVQDRGVTAIAITGEMANIRKRYRNLALLHDGIIQWCGATSEIDNAHNDHVTQMVNGNAVGPIKMRLRS